MNPPRILKSLVILLSIGGLARADEKPPVVDWTVKDVRGTEIKVPAADRSTVLVFARIDQPQSAEALANVKIAVEKSNVQVIVIFSGETAAAQGKALQADGKYDWPVVADPDFAGSGKMSVHVWPTTLVIRANGQQVAHLAGMPPTFAADLSNYLEFAGGKLDEPTLQRRLTTRETVTDGDDQKAARHLQVANRLFEAGDVAGARSEIEAGLKLQPGNAGLQVLMARVLVALNQPKDALDLLTGVAADALPTWQTSLVKAWALVGLEKWDDAKAVIDDAIRLNPQPGEAYYLAGVIYTHEKDLPRAAEAFRKAYESGTDGKKLLAVQAAGAEKH
ncbi:hypothetical protein BH10PLA1_BH10PLA1_03270 [soil metagenome]